MFYGDYSILQISGQSFVSDACACLSFVFDVNLRKKTGIHYFYSYIQMHMLHYKNFATLVKA